MKIQIISIGQLSSDVEKLVERYVKMSGWKLLFHELPHSNKKDPEIIKADEASNITKKIRKDSYLILLDAKGINLTSEKFASLIEEKMIQNNDIDFVIGGAFGLHESLLHKANLVLSLSSMTFPHQLAKLLLLEQIYRAQSIINNHPYHK
jgi:23S rRNA (pseudouridine1915-N3)-methyltransferase